MPVNDYPEPPDDPVWKHFPIWRPPPPPHTFEIALVLTGTVSAGTYTAGVIDFLIEALDQWSLARREEDAALVAVPRIPRHRVVLRVIAGASGGGIDAVLAARALSFSYPPASSESRDCERAKNPLFDLSVNTVDVTGLLGTSDLQGNVVTSLLCVEPLREGVKRMLDFTGHPSPGRDFVVNPLPVFLTFTNLAGIPYKLDFSGAGDRSEYFVNHADFIRFELGIRGAGAAPAYARAPDAIVVPAPAPGADWKFMQQYLLGTAAMPAGFPPVQVSRRAGDYSFRYFSWSDAAGCVHTSWLTPDWSRFVPPGTGGNSTYRFLSLDGGITDNDPIELARAWLAGIGSRNSRDGASANRAVIVVDPLAGVPAKPLLANPGPLKILLSLFNTLVQSSRYATADLSLLINPSVYSRYLVTPARTYPGGCGVLTGADALAGSRLGGFMGYMAKRFRVHDFMLGRRNCQAFLQTWLALPADNKVFLHDLKPAPVPAGSTSAGEIPLIPLCGSAAREQPEPGWPEGAFNPCDIRPQLRARIRALLQAYEYQLPGAAAFAWSMCNLNRVIAFVLALFATAPINAELERPPSLK